MSRPDGTLRARPTMYRGIAMRSRLEATFAAEMDEAGAVWVYEPRAYANARGQYLPDFQVLEYDGRAMPQPMFFEVRPTVELGMQALERMAIIWDSEPTAELYVAVPRHCWFHAAGSTRKWIVS